MSDSPTVSSLQQLLARPAPPSPASAHSITSPSSSPRRPPSPTTTAASACTSQKLGAPPPRAGWGSTISSAFGYGAAPPPAPAAARASSSATFAAGGQRARARERGRLPAWGGTVREVPLGEGEAFDESAAALEEDDDGEMDQLVESILWQAGHDQLDPPGPLLVIAGSRLPPPTEIPHAKMLAKLRRRLETFAKAGPYTVVLLVNPTPHAPTTANLVSAYLSVARTVRKNVRHIYIVGGGWWTRAILGIFSSTLLSAKSAEKLVQCATMSSLAQAVGAEAFKQVEFPLEVYVANAAAEKEIVMTAHEGESLGVFGRPLEQTMGEEQAGHQLPAVVRDCVAVLLEQGPRSVGVFRRSPSAAHVAHLRGAYDRGHPVSLSTLPDAAYLAASLLKLYLRELPAPLFPRGDLWNVSRACPVDDDDAALAHVRAELLPLLSAPVCTLLQHVLGVLAAVAAESDDNLMSSSNLVVCLCPALIGGLGDVPTMEEIEMCRVTSSNGTATIKGPGGATSGRENTVGGVLRIMIERYAEIFSLSSPVAVKPAQQIDSAPTASSLTPPSTSASSSRADARPTVPHPASPSPSSPPSASRSRSTSPHLFSSPPRLAHRDLPSGRRDVLGTVKIRKPARGGAKGGAGFLVEAFREENGEEDVQRVEAHGQLVSPGGEAGWEQRDEGGIEKMGRSSCRRVRQAESGRGDVAGGHEEWASERVRACSDGL